MQPLVRRQRHGRAREGVLVPTVDRVGQHRSRRLPQDVLLHHAADLLRHRQRAHELDHVMVDRVDFRDAHRHEVAPARQRFAQRSDPHWHSGGWLWSLQRLRPRGADDGYAAGARSSSRVKRKVLPWSALRAAHRRPPWASMIERLIERPMPRPFGLVLKKGLKTSAGGSGTPPPLSRMATSMLAAPAAVVVMVSERSASPEVCMASTPLSRRLSRTCSIWMLSQVTRGRSGASASST